MHRIDTPGSKNGLFKEEVRHEEGIEEATIISADWLNDVQENLCFVIERMGFKLEKNVPEQLFNSISNIVENGLGGIKRRVEELERQCGIK